MRDLEKRIRGHEDRLRDELELAAYNDGLREGYSRQALVTMRRWAIDCARSEPNLHTVEDQILHAEKLVAWVMGEGDGGQKTPDRAAA